MRGAGTSIAGNAVGPGHRRRHLPPPRPGAVARPRGPHRGRRSPAPSTPRSSGRRCAHGLRFGPDPSTHTRCTIGGMVGNNACGSRALGYGRTADNVVALEALTAAGDDVGVARRPRSTALVDRAPRHDPAPGSAGSAGRCPATPSSTCCPRTAARSTGSSSAPRARSRSSPRRPSGSSRTPRTGCSPCSATRRWPRPPTPYPALLAHRPVACEGMDERITAMVRRGPAAARGARAGCSSR